MHILCSDTYIYIYIYKYIIYVTYKFILYYLYIIYILLFIHLYYIYMYIDDWCLDNKLNIHPSKERLNAHILEVKEKLKKIGNLKTTYQVIEIDWNLHILE